MNIQLTIKVGDSEPIAIALSSTDATTNAPFATLSYDEPVQAEPDSQPTPAPAAQDENIGAELFHAANFFQPIRTNSQTVTLFDFAFKTKSGVAIKKNFPTSTRFVKPSNLNKLFIHLTDLGFNVTRFNSFKMLKTLSYSQLLELARSVDFACRKQIITINQIKDILSVSKAN